MSVLATLVANEPLDSLWKISAGLITPMLLIIWRRSRKVAKDVKDTFDSAKVLIHETVPSMARAIDRLEADVSTATTTLADHTTAINELATKVSSSGGMAEVVTTVIGPLMARMADAAEARAELNRTRSPARRDDLPGADHTDERALP